jgi:hypothetical protein
MLRSSNKTHHPGRLLIMALSLCAACNVPRNNPFDPQNPRSPYVTLEGRVHTQSLPRATLAEAVMFWKNGSRLAQTDAQGHFRFENLRPENDWLHIEKSGYKKDSVFVLWDGNKQIALDIFLNAMPVLENLQLSTEILHQYFSNQEARLAVKAGISDRDNDVDSVFVTSEKFGLRKALDYDVDDKSYIATLKLFDLKVNNLEELIGEDFRIVVKDRAADEIVVGKSGVKRVIQDEIEFESPAGDQVVSSTPTFIWKRFRPGFPFTFTLEVFTFEGLVFQKSGLPAASISYTMETPLAPGEYLWVVWCVDEFQNRSRSKPASFIVMQ